ncbi:MAG: flagellar biosynthetic protein FliQ [Thermotoga sp. 4484_232]|nr:flagellar biosynthesis protein FliQ [Thermotogaceae bacterium]OQX57300.1 MAG: flagellar biosynthetic protein FliQ [Thermotoga sp. 4484_232]RKX41417.1 MAG: flagellar biosynthetic protein FliQ [Thermotogota bacterium]RKX51073.1 MAG: flagellar biosynthetic protein FliQ [Thermotoga sp.]
MTVEVFIDVVREGISTLITIIIPPLLVSLAVGLVISIFQAVTQIHEQTLTFAPRIIAIFLTILVIGGWMLQKLLDLALDMLTRYFQMI